MLSTLFSFLLMVMPPCEYEDSNNCQHQGQFVALHEAGSPDTLLIFKDGSIEVVPSAY